MLANAKLPSYKRQNLAPSLFLLLLYSYVGAHGSEDKVVFRRLKGFFGKARHLMTNRSEEQFQEVSKDEAGEGSPKKQPLLGTDPFTWENPELGIYYYHMSFLNHHHEM